MTFGETDGSWPHVELANGLADDERADEGLACFLAEIGEARTITRDVRALTVEGGPIIIRYDSNGARVEVTTDSTRDA